MADTRKQSVRRFVMGGAFVATLAAGVLLGGLLGSEEAQAQPTVQFSGDAGLMFDFVKPSAQADYERVIGRLGAALQQSEAPGRQDQARGWKVFKAAQDFSGQGAVLYVWVVDPNRAGSNYAAATIISEAFPDETQELYETLVGAYVDGQLKRLPMQLQLVADF